MPPTVRKMSTCILAIDPGPKLSGMVELWCDQAEPSIIDAMNASNEVILNVVADSNASVLVIEHFSDRGSFGRMDAAHRDTMVWLGRFWQESDRVPRDVDTITRLEVLKHLGLAGRKGTDALVRGYLIARYRASSGESAPERGVLKGVTNHAWQALALGIAWWDLQRLQRRESLTS